MKQKCTLPYSRPGIPLLLSQVTTMKNVLCILPEMSSCVWVNTHTCICVR